MLVTVILKVDVSMPLEIQGGGDGSGHHIKKLFQ